MNAKETELKLYLDNIGIPFSIQDFEDRLIIQKAVYIGKIAGVNLGYSFNHYKKGPYCSELTDNYYKLNSSLDKGDEGYKKYKLNWEIEDKIARFKDIFYEFETNEKCISKNLKNQGYWLETIASLVYWIKRGLDMDKAKDTVLKMKDYLEDYLDCAEDAIKKYNLC